MEKNRKKTKGSKGSRIWRIMVLLCLAVFCVSAAGLGWTQLSLKKEDDTFQQLADIVRKQPQAEGNETAAVQAQVTGSVVKDEVNQSIDYTAIYELNQDFTGWLQIAGTPIDYPVMGTPKDPQYYIRRDFYGNESVSGTLFLGEGCDTESQSMIIYGHNMKNKTMFGSLSEYAKESYWQEHPVISFDTLQEHRQYEVFAAFQTRLFYENEVGFRYHEYSGDLTRDDFDDFIIQVDAAALYHTGIEPEYGDQIMILSTCSYHEENGRFVVVARYAK